MSTIRTTVLSAFAIIVFTQCQAPPPGSVVFDGDNNPDEVVMDYLDINKDEFEGYPMIPIPLDHLREPGDTVVVYAPRTGAAAKFE